MDLAGFSRAARAEGLRTLRQAGLEKVAQGLTTIEEVLSVLPPRMNPAPFLIVETGRPVPPLRRYGRFPHWIRVAAGLEEHETVVVDVEHGDALPDPHAFAGVLVTGSAAFVTDHADWSERSAAWLRQTAHAGLPVFGICYGHQLLAHALGARWPTTRLAESPARSNWNCSRRRHRTRCSGPAAAFRRPRHPPADRAACARGCPGAGTLAAGWLPCIPLGPPGLGCSSIRNSPPTTCAATCVPAPTASVATAAAPAPSSAQSAPRRWPASCCAVSCAGAAVFSPADGKTGIIGGTGSRPAPPVPPGCP